MPPAPATVVAPEPPMVKLPAPVSVVVVPVLNVSVRPPRPRNRFLPEAMAMLEVDPKVMFRSK